MVDGKDYMANNRNGQSVGVRSYHTHFRFGPRSDQALGRNAPGEDLSQLVLTALAKGPRALWITSLCAAPLALQPQPWKWGKGRSRRRRAQRPDHILGHTKESAPSHRRRRLSGLYRIPLLANELMTLTLANECHLHRHDSEAQHQV